VIYRVGLRYRDLDLYGHVNHVAYHDLLDEARANFIAAINDDELMSLVVRRVEVDYLAEIRQQDRHVEVRTEVDTVGTRSITFAHQVIRPDRVIAANSRAVMVAFDPVDRRSRLLTAAERARLTAPLAPAEPVRG
jgi:acyl-CoA thioester hydrolase